MQTPSSSPSGASVPAMTDLTETLDAIAAESAFSGVVRVDRGDEVVLETAYGFADRRWEIPNAPDTCFLRWRAASSPSRAPGRSEAALCRCAAGRCEAVCDCPSLDPVRHGEFAQDVRDVNARGLHADDELVGDLTVRVATRHER